MVGPYISDKFLNGGENVQRKISKSGNSYRVTLPIDWMREINARFGKEAKYAKLEYSKDGIFRVIPLGVDEDVIN